MSRVVAALVLLALAAAGVAYYVLGRTEDGGVEYPDPPFLVAGKDSPRLETPELLPDPEERAAYEASQQKRYVQAREMVARRLDRDADDAVALYVLACVEAFGDGNLPRGLHYVRRLRHRMEEKGRADPGDVRCREWYLRALETEAVILSDLDRRPEELRAIEVVEGATASPTPWKRMWPLIKMKRFDDARAAGRATLEQFPARGADERLTALNGLSATEFEARERVACYEAGGRMVEEFPNSAVLSANRGEAAELVFRLEEAQSTYERAATMKYQDFNGTAFHYLARVQVARGRLHDALESLRKGKAQRLAREAYTLQQDEAESLVTHAIFFVAAGRPEEALRSARRACELPDRAGATSNEKEIDQVAACLARRAAVLSGLEALREETGTRAFLENVFDREIASLRLEALEADRRLLGLLSSERLELRPYLLGHSAPPSWLLGTLAGFLPPAVARRAIDEASAAESHPGAGPYFDAMAAEVALELGRDDDALRLAVRAREEIPEAEALLRGRLAAVAAVAALRLGRPEEEREHLATAFAEFPAGLRLVGASVPVRLERDGSDPAAQVADALRRSPRLREDASGFPLSVRLEGDRLAIRLEGAGPGFESIVDVSADVAPEAVRSFHHVLATGGLDLREKDLQAVEGSSLPSSGS